jgi:MFS family permease
MEVFVMFLGGPIFGKLFDNYGPRYILLFGTFCHVFGLMMTSLSTQYYQILLAQGVCSAIGASAIFCVAMSSIGTWFFRRRATAFGIVASGSSLGGVIMPIFVTKLIPRIGFPWTMRAAAFLILGMCLIANLTVSSRLTPRPSKLELMEFVRPLRDPAFALVCVGGFMFFWGTFLPFNVGSRYQKRSIHTTNGFVVCNTPGSAQRHVGQPLFVSSINFERILVSQIQLLNDPLRRVANLSNRIFGRILPGIIADRVGRFNVMIMTAAASSILVLALWLPAKSNAPIIIFSVLYGFSSGAFVGLSPSLIAQISPIQKIGVRNGSFFLFVSLAGLTGSPIGGALIGKDDGAFDYLQIFGGVTMAVGAAFYLASRWVQCGFKLKII